MSVVPPETNAREDSFVETNPPPDDFATEQRGLSRLGRRWAWILSGGVIGATVGVVLTLVAAPVYEARTT
ncbi:hypothetical protein EON77_15650, partial [bacterium]